MRRAHLVQLAVCWAILTGCALRTDVHVRPLYLESDDIQRAAGVRRMWEIGDFARARTLTALVESSSSYEDLIALGKCELASLRLSDARRHLRAALDLNPPRHLYAEAAWYLSQVEYLANNFAAAEEWANTATDHGLKIKKWHVRYLAALANTQVHQFRRSGTSKVHMTFGHPDIPRVAASVNGGVPATAVIDSGAVLSIISTELAQKMGVRSLGEFEGEFLGLLGEPIPVRFGILDSLRIGEIEVTSVPVAIMPDRSLQFFVLNREPFKMDLLLGASLLREFRMEFDFRKSHVTFTTLTPEQKRPVDNQNLFFSDFRPVVHAAVNGRGWFPFLLDTGSEVTFLKSDALFGDRKGFVRMHSTTLQGLGGSQKQGQKLEAIEIGVDRWVGRFSDIPLYEAEAKESHGIIGQNFMKHFKVVVDFGTMRMDLRR